MIIRECFVDVDAEVRFWGGPEL